MPDQTRLDERLARGRAELLDSIDQPPLARLGARATARRRRRHAARAGVALAAVLGIGLAVVRPWHGDSPAVPDVADVPPGAVYTDAGITINGLDALGGSVRDLTGTITDVEFPNPDKGYAISCDEERCAIGRTADGGLTWQSSELPAGLGTSVDLLPFPGDVLVAATGGRTAWTSTDGGRRWQATEPGTGAVASAGSGDLLRVGDAEGDGGGVEVWSSRGFRGTLANEPPIRPLWVAAGPAADGDWWVGGVDRGTNQPAVAVSADGGASWKRIPLPVSGADEVFSVQVSMLGRHAYALVLGGEASGARRIEAIFHSADGGATFTPTRRPGASGGPDAVAGELIPLLDGRLLIASGDSRWYVSADDGATFAMGGDLPPVGRLAMTPGGYVAYDLFRSDWAAFSSDGSTWRKLRAH